MCVVDPVNIIDVEIESELSGVIASVEERAEELKGFIVLSWLVVLDSEIVRISLVMRIEEPSYMVVSTSPLEEELSLLAVLVGINDVNGILLVSE